jgi:DNA-directed RNA polymerase delta subunit
VISQLLEEHGGLMERNYLLNALVNFSVNGVKPKPEDVNVHKSHLDFLISKLLHNDLEEISKSDYFNKFFKLKFSTIDYLEELAKELLDKIRETKKIILTEDLINLTRTLNAYGKYKEKFNMDGNLDMSNVLGGDYFNENAEIVNKNKIIYSIVQALKNLEQNKFGYWGMNDWRDIKPKTINDKIYLVLKQKGKPMHFVEIAEEINKIGFDGKKANAATVHNELILDSKYVLIGRGLYGLKDWGYQQGTVADIIADILKKSDVALSREEIIEKVLEQRMVKKATINLALMNKQKFEKTEEGKYRLNKA